jgi:hypothetical protein
MSLTLQLTALPLSCMGPSTSLDAAEKRRIFFPYTSSVIQPLNLVISLESRETAWETEHGGIVMTCICKK